MLLALTILEEYIQIMARPELILGEGNFLSNRNVIKRNPLPSREITEALLTIGATASWFLFTKNFLEYVNYKQRRRKIYETSSKLLAQVFPK